MKRTVYILFILLIFATTSRSQDSLRFSGQASSWVNLNKGNTLPVMGGVRYIPQLNYYIPVGKSGKLDAEFSARISGSAGIHPFDSLSASGLLKPYRAWLRYSGDQFELRFGLQKLNFGSASLLRPLMWFDQIDPRDPLKLTDGVWGVLGRYYFLNNTNIWLWGLYGNKNPRGWDFAETNRHFPEMGGRIQVPVPAGEAALSFNHRIVDMSLLFPQYSELPENRIGFDIKLDLVVGLWLEGSWVNKNGNTGFLKNQEILNAGTDYTFGIGNGLYVIFEQLLAANNEKPFDFQNSYSFSLLSVSYPVGMFDNLSGIVYYDWKNKNTYNFLSWQKQFNNLSFYLMGYWNPERYNIPAQGTGENLFAGKGIQVMLVYNH